jgi:hypothetical protein
MASSWISFSGISIPGRIINMSVLRLVTWELPIAVVN